MEILKNKNATYLELKDDIENFKHDKFVWPGQSYGF